MSSSRFEERLLQELRGVVEARPAPESVGRRRAPRLALSGAGVAAAVTAAVVVTVSGGGGADPAFAVESRPGGAVSVTINSLRDAAGLERKLREKGIPADVSYASVPGTIGMEACAPPPPPAAPPSGKGLTQRTERRGVGGATSGPTTEMQAAPPPAGEGRRRFTTGVHESRSGETTFELSPGQFRDGERLKITTSAGTRASISMQIVGRGDGYEPAC